MNSDLKKSITAEVKQLKTFLKGWKKLSKDEGVHPHIQQAMERLYEVNQAELDKLKQQLKDEDLADELDAL